MEEINVYYQVVSKMTGNKVDFGKRHIMLIGKKSAKDHVRDTIAFLRNLWTPAAYEISVKWLPSDD